MYLRHPVIGLVCKSCIDKPQSPIQASIHAKINNTQITITRIGNSITVNMAV